MKFINKIEIKYFRSFSDKVVKIENIKDLNIFSWWNDSWKSNVLRALNLFFNWEVSHWQSFIFDRDFSKFQLENSIRLYDEKKWEWKDSKKKDQFIEIKVYFDLSDNEYWKILPKKFWISKKWTKTKNSELNHNIETIYKKENQLIIDNLEKGSVQYSNTFNNLKKSITTFQNRIEFFYVPAIKDYSFFKELYALLQAKMNSESSEKIEESKKILQDTIKEETENFFKKFKKSTWLNAAFLIEHELLDFRRNIEVETWKDILLTSRWDWVQARLIPDILDELSNKNKYIIWWFEEPENSYEYKHAKKLANDFYSNYSNDKQIFITTHSKEFLWIKDENNLSWKSKLSIYRVFKDANEQSKIERYDEKSWFSKEKIKQMFLTWLDENKLPLEKIDTLKNIYDDLWIIDEARIISDLESKIESLNLEKKQLEDFQIESIKSLEEKEKILKENKKLKETLDRVSQSKIVIFCENKNADDLSMLWINEIEFIPSSSKLYAWDSAKNKDSSVFALIDKDFLTDAEKQFIEEKTNVRLFNYYCFENYLYHPENLKEYYEKKTIEFDMLWYINDIVSEFKENFEITKINDWRRSHQSINEYCISVYDSKILNNINKSENFEEIYKYFSMKNYCTKLAQRQNIRRQDLINTEWFKEKIQFHLNSMWIFWSSVQENNVPIEQEKRRTVDLSHLMQ